jgi:YVTN family beta-propeller protein
MDKIDKVGPHDICLYSNKILIANSYSNSLSIIDAKEGKEQENYFIGMHCNGVKAYEDNAYIICGESNSLVVFNLLKRKIIEKIPCGSFPCSISINEKKNLIAVANMHSDNITIVDCRNRDNIRNIKVSAYPAKTLFSTDGEHVIVCESKLGMCKKGTVNIIDLNTEKSLNSIEVGFSPMDAFVEEDYCYVSNFGDGTISIIDMKQLREIKRIKLGGTPRGLVKSGNFIYVCDNCNNHLVRVNLKNKNKRVIAIGGEPTAMTLY